MIYFWKCWFLKICKLSVKFRISKILEKSENLRFFQDFPKILKILIFKILSKKVTFFKLSKITIFENLSKIYPTLKIHNFFSTGPILKFFDVPKSSWSVLFHSRIYFPGRFPESSSSLGLNFLDFAVDQIFSILVILLKLLFSMFSIIM